MKKIAYYTEEEKKLFLDYFIYKGDEVKFTFKEYLQSYIQNNGTELPEHVKPDNNIISIHPYETNRQYAKKNKNSLLVKNEKIFSGIQRNQWQYDSHHMLWDNINNDNILTFILSHPDFDISYQKIKQLNSLHPNWNHKNRDGDTALHILAKQGQTGLITHLVKEFNLDVNTKNKNGDYYTYCFLLTENKFLSSIRGVAEHFNSNTKHIEKISMNKLLELKTNIENLKDKHFNFIKKTLQKESLYTKEKDSDIALNISNEFKAIDSIIQFKYMEIVTQKEKNEQKLVTEIKETNNKRKI